MRPPLSRGQSPPGMVMEPLSLSMMMHRLRGTLQQQQQQQQQHDSTQVSGFPAAGAESLVLVGVSAGALLDLGSRRPLLLLFRPGLP